MLYGHVDDQKDWASSLQMFVESSCGMFVYFLEYFYDTLHYIFSLIYLLYQFWKK